MRVKSLHIVLSALAILALTSSLALARGGMGGGQGGQGSCPGMGGGWGQLSPEKQAAFQKLHDAFAAKTAQLRADLGVKMAELNALSVAATPDQAKIDAVTKQIGDLQAKLLSERTQFRIQVSKEVGAGVAGGGCPGMGGYHGGGCQ
ncbi:periplasmic heavy metal sensor [Solidesulfovibrio magneticus]|uniref:Zinc resistance-associated protein n=1 Tax=Solidesulfovibrio magneticus (strain ATCC 700980 / DSM 13731 / RS-1) TaxID=573370 RepID=C4XRU6_SOLM1|nr:periplasmic heavy metal sensor [Solidesulfovibrio magneticus]BAH78012.1 putative zinc resistance-associated protein precursor [Solidesulfovibrio magneticus RS-1]